MPMITVAAAYENSQPPTKGAIENRRGSTGDESTMMIGPLSAGDCSAAGRLPPAAARRRPFPVPCLHRVKFQVHLPRTAGRALAHKLDLSPFSSERSRVPRGHDLGNQLRLKAEPHERLAARGSCRKWAFRRARSSAVAWLSR